MASGKFLGVMAATLFITAGAFTLDPAVSARLKELRDIRIQQLKADADEKVAKAALAQAAVVEKTIGAFRVFFKEMHGYGMKQREQNARLEREHLEAEARAAMMLRLGDGLAAGLTLALPALALGMGLSLPWVLLILRRTPSESWASVPSKQALVIRPLAKPRHRPRFTEAGAVHLLKDESEKPRAA